MREKEIMEKMQSEVVIPDVVQERAELAFEKIRKKEGKVVKMRTKKRRWKTTWAAATAAVFVFGTMTVYAAYLHWSKGMEAEFNATDEQKKLLEEQQYTAPLDNGDGSDSVTVEGVTVTAQQSIADSRFAWLSFKVEGYDLEEGKEPCFQDVTVVADGDINAPISYYGDFYNGVHTDENGKAVYEDGTLMKEEIFAAEDGSMEYIITIDATQYGGLIGKNVHVDLTDLGTVHKADYTPDLEAVWSFDFTLKGSDKVRTLTLSEPLGDSGAAVIYAEISPISIYVNYDFPLQKETIEGVDENGAPITSTRFVEVPPIAGVRLKDGTLLLHMTGGGAEGYLDESHEVYTASYMLNRILDTDQVDALLFGKNQPEENRSLTEEDLYIVPLMEK